MGNYFKDIIEKKDPVTRKKNLDALIAERAPTEILVLTIISIVSDDDVIRRTALERLNERNREEGDTAARVASLIQSWRSEGAIMTWPEPMNAEQNRRAAEIEAACHARFPLASVVKSEAPYSKGFFATSWWRRLFGLRTQTPPEAFSVSEGQKEETINLAGTIVWDEVRNLQSMALEQEQLLARLGPIPHKVANDFFRRLGVPQPNEYHTALDAFSSFRQFALTSEGSTVHTWYLQLRPSSEKKEALYIHIDDPVIPLGFAVCKLISGAFIGYYATGSKFKEKLGL